MWLCVHVFQHVTIEGEFIITGAGFKEERQIKILFDESFFNSKDESYQVLCIDHLLEGGTLYNVCVCVYLISLGSEDHTSTVVSLETLEDCNSFLWSDPGLFIHPLINSFIHFSIH